MSLTEDFLNNELSDYSFWEYNISAPEESNDTTYYYVEVTGIDDKVKHLTFKEDKNDLQILLGEEYHTIEYFDWTVKYFWMALLKW